MSEKAHAGPQETQPSDPNSTEDLHHAFLPFIYGSHTSPTVQDQYGNVPRFPAALSNRRISIQTLPSAVTTRPIRNQDLLTPGHSRQFSIQESPPTVHSRQVSSQEPPPPATHTHQVSIQEPSPIIHGRKVSNQGSLPTAHGRRVSIQEPLPTAHSSQASIREPLPTAHSSQASIEGELPPATRTRRVSIQEPPPVTRTRRVSIQEPPPATTFGRRLSVQGPPSAAHGRRLSVQGFLPVVPTQEFSIRESPTGPTHRLSIQESPPTVHSSHPSIQESLLPVPIRHPSTQETPPTAQGRHPSIRESLPTVPSRHPSTQETPPTAQGRHPSIRESPSTVHSRHPSTRESLPTVPTQPLKDQKPLLDDTHSAYKISQSNVPQTPTETQDLTSKPTWPKDHVPPSITQSPAASIESLESVTWSSQVTPKETGLSFQFHRTIPADLHEFLLVSSTSTSASRFQKSSSRQIRLPICWRLLHEARKISRHLSLVLTVAGLVIIGFISLSKPWMHFQVPLEPPGNPSGTPTIAINTMLIVGCSDMSCMKDYDQNAYLLDLSWTFFFFSSVTSFCLCMALIFPLFFTSSNLPMLDFILFIGSIMTERVGSLHIASEAKREGLTITVMYLDYGGLCVANVPILTHVRDGLRGRSWASMALGVLFYLWQAERYLQEGMTYRLGISFYLAWIGIFLFMMTGFFSYLNYMNFWSILALQAVWT